MQPFVGKYASVVDDLWQLLPQRLQDKIKIPEDKGATYSGKDDTISLTMGDSYSLFPPTYLVLDPNNGEEGGSWLSSHMASVAKVTPAARHLMPVNARRCRKPLVLGPY